MKDLSVKQLVNQHRLAAEEGRNAETAEDGTDWRNLRGRVRAELVGRGLTALAECLAWESLFTRTAGLSRSERRAERMRNLVKVIAEEIDDYTDEDFGDLVEADPNLRTIWNTLTTERLRVARSRYLAQDGGLVIDSAMWDALSPWTVDILTTEDPPETSAVARLITEGVLDWYEVALARSEELRGSHEGQPFVVAGEKVVLTSLGRKIVDRHRVLLEKKSS